MSGLAGQPLDEGLLGQWIQPYPAEGLTVHDAGGDLVVRIDEGRGFTHGPHA